MKKRITFITFLMLLCSVSFGQNWEVLDYNYSNNMELIATVTVQGEAVESIEVAAFDEDGNVRGVAFNTYDEDFDKYILNMIIHGSDNYEPLTFKAYDHNKNVLLSSDTHFDFIINETQGSWNTPLEIDFYSVHWNENDIVYNTETSMTITGVVHIDGVYQGRDYLEIAAFCGDELRGIGRTCYDDYYNKFVAYIFVSGTDNENISFKLYDHSNENATELTSINTVNFVTDENLGYNTPPFAINFISQSVAKIGDVYYTSLAAAVEAAGTGEIGTTITLLKDVEGSGIVINKSITIDFGGFTYTFNEGVGNIPSNGFQILNGNTVTLQNGKLEVAETAASTFYILVQNYANLNVTKMTLDGKNLDKWSATDGDSYVLSNNSGNVNISESKIIANDEGSKAFAFDVCKYTSYDAPYVTLDANSNIQGKVELSGGQLKSAQAVNATIKKDIEAYLDEDEDLNLESGWYTICFPFTFTDETIHNLADDDSYDLYRYDEAGAIWVNHKKHDSDNDGNEDQDQLPFGDITLGNGYLYAHASGKIIEATGKVNIAESTTVALTASNEGNLKGFNLIGNPYTHNITTDHFSDVTLAVGFYTLSNHGAWTAVENGSIAPMQGILVKTTEAGNLNIKKDINGKRSENEDNGSIMISVSNEKYTDVAYVSFNEGIGLDKIYHRNINVPMVYIPVENVNYAIATMSHDITEILVSFRAMTMGEYTISVKSQNCEYSSMTLVDRQTGTETNLLVEDYTFLAKTNDNADRFIIKLNNSQQSTDNSHFAYINNGMINIDNIVGQAMINVYDVTGRSVAKYNVSESVCISTSYFANGMYIIKMTDENGIKVQKIIIE